MRNKKYNDLIIDIKKSKVLSEKLKHYREKEAYYLISKEKQSIIEKKKLISLFQKKSKVLLKRRYLFSYFVIVIKRDFIVSFLYFLIKSLIF